jgi:hypothetical protein
MNSLLRRTFVVCLLAIPLILHAQDSCKVVILSPRVGTRIDREEQEYFKLFRQFPTFQSAIVLQGPGSAYYVRIEYYDSEGRLRDSIIEYQEPVLLMVAEKINHFEALEGEIYVFGSDPASLQFADTVVAVPLPAPRASVQVSAPVSTAKTSDDVTQTHPAIVSSASRQGTPWQIATLSGESANGFELDSLHGQALITTCGGKTVSIAVDSITALVRDKGSHSSEGGMIGAAVGGIAGVLIVSNQYHPSQSNEGSLGPDPGVIFEGLFFALGGGVVGGAVGYGCGALIGSTFAGHEMYDLKGKTLSTKLHIIKKLVQNVK